MKNFRCTFRPRTVKDTHEHSGMENKNAYLCGMRRFTTYAFAAACLLLAAGETFAQKREKEKLTPTQHQSQMMQYITEGTDTIYIGTLPAARVYDKLPKQKGREWRKYYRLVYNFSKVYPYALVARSLIHDADSTIAAQNLKRLKRDKYITSVQNELFTVFEKPMRSLTISQGALLMKLIDRECGKSSYLIIKDYKNGMAASFWQGVAKMFGSDLKAPYDPDGADKATEELVRMWDNGEFDGLYYSLFWEYPKLPDIPAKYR